LELPAYYSPNTPMHNLEERLRMVFDSDMPDAIKKLAIRQMYSDVEKLFTSNISELNDATIVFWKKLEIVQKDFKPILSASAAGGSINEATSGYASPLIN
jgi:hypothetical protein